MARSNSKTALLIEQSHRTRTPIVVRSRASAERIMQQAMAMGVSIPKPVIKNHSRYSLPSKERGCTRLRTDRMIPRDGDDSAWWIVGAMIVAACFFVFLCEIGVIP